MSNLNPINCHVHIFNSDMIPESILGKRYRFILKMIKNAESDNGLRVIIWVLRPFIGRSKAQRLLALASSIILSSSQRDVLINLIKVYTSMGLDKMQFILLCQDMDHTGIPSSLYCNATTQMNDVYCNIIKDPDLRDRVHPFIAVDPRGVQAPLDIVKKYHRMGFKGIKIYPTVGFYGDDDRLMPMYEYAEKNKLPIMVHYNAGVIYYRGGLPYRIDKAVFKYKKHKDYQLNFLNPTYFRNVLNKHKNLKICFAHFAGAMEDGTYPNLDNYTQDPYAYFENQYYDNEPPKPEEVKAYTHLYVKTLINDPSYPNVFTDVSYDLSRPVFKEKVLQYMNQSDELRNRIMFGTDYFVNIKLDGLRSEMEIVQDFMGYFDQNGLLDQLMIRNTNAYL